MKRAISLTLPVLLCAGLAAGEETPALRLAGSILAENGISAEVPAAPATVPGQPADGASYSKTYAEVRSNNDGSTTIVSPAFKDPAGLGSLWISGRSSTLDGVCKLFGFGAAQASLNIFKAARSPAVYINASGKFAGFVMKEHWPLHYLTCAAGKASESLATPSASSRAEKISRNDDGSFALLKPFVEGEGGRKNPINWNSSGQGVCRYFGFSRYVAFRITADRYPATAVISSEGRISGFINGLENNYAFGVDSVVCEK